MTSETTDNERLMRRYLPPTEALTREQYRRLMTDPPNQMTTNDPDNDDDEVDAQPLEATA